MYVGTYLGETTLPFSFLSQLKDFAPIGTISLLLRVDPFLKVGRGIKVFPFEKMKEKHVSVPT